MTGRAEAEEGRWSLVSTIRAPIARLERFVQHYEELGAARIYLFFEEPESFRYYTNRGAGIVEPTYDEAVDAGEGADLNGRQITNFETARGRARTPWLLHVDGDEFVFARRRVSEVLREFDDRTYSVTMPPMEAVYRTEPKGEEALSTRWFRRTVDNAPLLEAIYGDLAPLTRQGLFGHTAGKSFVRTDIPVDRPSVHSPKPRARGLAVGAKTNDLDFLHFDALAFDDWRAKFALRLDRKVSVAMGAARREQLKAIRRAQHDDQALRELYRRMHVFAEDRFDLAVAAGFLAERNLRASCTR
jgi:Glycosyl transferase family 2